MRTKPVVALPEVESDLRQATAHYASWHPAGAAGFLDKYDATIGWMEWNPDSFPKKYGSVQRAIIKRTYYPPIIRFGSKFLFLRFLCFLWPFLLRNLG